MGGSVSKGPNRSLLQRWQSEATAARAEAQALDSMLADLHHKWHERELATKKEEARAREKQNAEAYAARIAEEAAAEAAKQSEEQGMAAGRKKKLALDRRNDRLKVRTIAYCDRYFGRGINAN